MGPGSLGVPGAVPTLHVVTDDAVLARDRAIDLAERMLRMASGPVAIHLRGHRIGGRALYGIATRLHPLARERGCTLVVNDRVDVALAVGGLAVHLGDRSMPVEVARSLLPAGTAIGVSAHSAEEAARAASDGADWIFSGTIWATASHPGVPPVGLEGLAASVAVAGRVPVLAIGGVTPSRAADAVREGARGVAVIRGVWDAPDPAEAVNEYLEAMRGTPRADGTGSR